MRRYRISTEVLILILENLDPPSLFRACKAFVRVHHIVMEYQWLRYRFELALAGMKDGRAPRAPGAPFARYQLLLTYKKDWPRLHWSHEYKIQIPTPAHVGMSGGFIHRIHTQGTQHTLELTELPSYRTGRPLSRTRHLRFSTPPIESVAIDPPQGLLVTTHLFSQGGLAAIQIYFRDVWSFAKHPWAPAISYEFNTHSPIRVSHISLQICGSKIGISMEFVGGRIKHLLMDWRTTQAMWLEDPDILFLNETHMLVIKKNQGRPLLSLLNISQVPNITTIREYELPEAWSNSSIGFCANTSPRTDSAASPEALFYPDPSARLLLLTVKPASSTPSSNSPRNWLFINEAYFRHSSRRDRVSWDHWGQHCLIRAMPPIPSIRGPYLVGTRVLFLDSEPGQASRGQVGRPTAVPRLNLIDFRPFNEGLTLPARVWTIGMRATVVPVDLNRDVPLATVDHLNVDGIRVNEDNIVLFMELRQGMRNVNVLTFGGPPTTRSRH